VLSTLECKAARVASDAGLSFSDPRNASDRYDRGNLEEALAILTQARPEAFPSPARYDYRITNAFAPALARSLGDKRTEATGREILDPANVTRVRQELEGMQLVVLCGNRAAYLREELYKSGRNVIQCSHTSNQGLNSRHNSAVLRASTPNERRKRRIHSWAMSLLLQL
jgi:uracil-DNA glycosylase